MVVSGDFRLNWKPGTGEIPLLSWAPLRPSDSDLSHNWEPGTEEIPLFSWAPLRPSEAWDRGDSPTQLGTIEAQWSLGARRFPYSVGHHWGPVIATSARIGSLGPRRFPYSVGHHWGPVIATSATIGSLGLGRIGPYSFWMIQCQVKNLFWTSSFVAPMISVCKSCLSKFAEPNNFFSDCYPWNVPRPWFL
jgi:hypothetical protein